MNYQLDFGRLGPRKQRSERKPPPVNVRTPPRHQATTTSPDRGLVNVGRLQLLVRERQEPAPQLLLGRLCLVPRQLVLQQAVRDAEESESSDSEDNGDGHSDEGEFNSGDDFVD
ncbi:hypothetical protein C8R44DRAFT_753167 [Mycena epipterygia]|nr:hypothetical protein C8R44DRAFT_753167 [Mycena epipterygia]